MVRVLALLLTLASCHPGKSPEEDGPTRCVSPVSGEYTCVQASRTGDCPILNDTADSGGPCRRLDDGGRHPGPDPDPDDAGSLDLGHVLRPHRHDDPILHGRSLR